MNLREFAVIDAINQAGWIRRDFWASAKEIADTLNDKKDFPYLEDARKLLGVVTARDIGYMLRALSDRWPRRAEPLVEKRRVHGQNQWRTSKHGLTVSIA